MMNGYTQQQLKSLSLAEANQLTLDVRQFLVDHVLTTGGHLASNLGIVEISLGLLRVFSLPQDDIIYDTGHQSYVHKLLTGRLEGFESLRQYGGISGFPRRSESEYDSFGAGHSGTAISAALGLCRARAKKNRADHGQHTVAVIGDGALTNGMVYEALNNIRRDDQIIVVLNDNDMSISKSVGRLSRYLTRVRRSEKYFSFKEKSHSFLHHVPLIGRPIERGLSRLKNWVKSLVYRKNLFETIGMHYLGPANGNDLGEVEHLLQAAKRRRGPVLVHLHTVKGKGYSPAEEDPGRYHSVSAGFLEGEHSFSQVFGQTLCKLAQEDKTVVAITAAMESGTGLEEFHRRFSDRFYDVGISEEHAMTFAAGLSVGGMKPVFAVYSTFFQRAYDQLFHDLALQELGAVIALDRAGFTDSDGPTHHGLFDVSLALSLPGVQVFSPATYQELERCLTAALTHFSDAPIVLRYPKGSQKGLICSRFHQKQVMEKWDSGPNPQVLLLSYGRITEQALLAADRLAAVGVDCTVVKLTCLKPFDAAALKKMLGREYKLCFALEEGVRLGGFFERLFAAIACNESLRLASTYRIRAVEDAFVPHGSYDCLLTHCKMDAADISREIASLL